MFWVYDSVDGGLLHVVDEPLAIHYAGVSARLIVFQADLVMTKI